jgi:hypothetical protein
MCQQVEYGGAPSVSHSRLSPRETRRVVGALWARRTPAGRLREQQKAVRLPGSGQS